MIEVTTAALYIVRRYESDYGRHIDDMKLHKLLYFAQRESFVLLGHPMFADKFEAWKYGPVMRSLRESGWMNSPIPSLDDRSEYKRVIDEVLARYASMDSWSLSNISHGETCWRKAKDKETGAHPACIETSDIEYDAKVIKYRRMLCQS